MNLREATNRLLDELARTGQLTAQAHTYLNQAVRRYRTKAYWFNDIQYDFVASASVEYHNFSAVLGMPRALNITINNNTYPLERRTMSEMNDMYISGQQYQGYPQDYAVYNRQFRLGPIPGYSTTASSSGTAQFVINVQGRAFNEELTAVSATNALLTHAPDLIIARAGRLMCTKILQDDKRAIGFANDELEAKTAVQEETNGMMRGAGNKRNSRRRP